MEEVADRLGLAFGGDRQEPLLALLPGFHHPLDDYALQLLIRDCMDEEGYETTAVRPYASLVFDDRSHERIVDRVTAERFGYQLDPVETSYEQQMMQTLGTSNESLDQDGQAALEKCGRASVEALGVPNDQIAEQLFSSSHVNARAAIEDSAEVSSWRTCMAPAGVGDLPDSPFEMPPPSVVTPQSGADLPARTPSAREIEVAVTDASCRESSGVVVALEREIARRQLEGIASNVEGFEALRERSQTYAKRVEATVARLGD